MFAIELRVHMLLVLLVIPIQCVMVAANMIKIAINQPKFNTQSKNRLVEWSRFQLEVENLLIDGPYSTLSEIQKCQLFCNWMGKGASKKAQTIKMQHKDDDTEQDRNELKHLLDAFGDCITPLRSFIHNRQLIVIVTPSICADQSEFLYKLCSVAKDCKFSDSNDVIKLLFLINNKNAEVRFKLLEEVKDTSTLDEYLDIAHRIEFVAEAEKLAKSNTSTTQL